MKKILILTAIAGLGYLNSYSQAEAATRFVEDPNAPKKSEEVKVENPLETEKAAKAKSASKKTASLTGQISAEEKMKLEEDKKSRNANKQPASKSAKDNKSNSSLITPVIKN